MTPEERLEELERLEALDLARLAHRLAEALRPFAWEPRAAEALAEYDEATGRKP